MMGDECKMKIFISADLEGIWGVVSKDHTTSQSKEYSRTRQLMMQEVNWAVEEAFNNGATEVIINDSHGGMDNLLIEDLDPRAQLITGSPKPLSMMEGISEEFDGVIFIGYHPRAGTTSGIYDHTYSGRTISSVYINGKLVGECGINSGVAGYFNVPILAITGDDKVALQAKEEIGDIETIVVKDTSSRHAARNVSLQGVRQQYKEKLARAFDKITQSPVIKYQGEIRMDVEFNSALMAEMAMLLPQAERKNPKTITMTSDDYLKLFKMFRAVMTLGGSV